MLSGTLSFDWCQQGLEMTARLRDLVAAQFRVRQGQYRVGIARRELQPVLGDAARGRILTAGQRDGTGSRGQVHLAERLRRLLIQTTGDAAVAPLQGLFGIRDGRLTVGQGVALAR